MLLIVFGERERARERETVSAVCEQISAGGRELVREGPIRDIELLVGAKNIQFLRGGLTRIMFEPCLVDWSIWELQ